MGFPASATSVMYRHASGRLPSMSSTPYSFASWPLFTVWPLHRSRAGSAARAATVRPQNVGVSEIAKCGTREQASRQFSSVTP